MKRLLSAILIFCLLITISPTGTLAAGGFHASAPVISTLEYKTQDVQNLPYVPDFDYDFPKPSDQWRRMIVQSGQAPAAFKDVKYTLADNVVVLEAPVSDEISSAGRLISGGVLREKSIKRIISDGGYINKTTLDAALDDVGQKPQPGMVVIDKTAGTTFKITSSSAFAQSYGDAKIDEQVKALKDTYMVEQPRFQEVLKDFSLGGSSPQGESVTLTRGNIDGFADGVEKCLTPETMVTPLAFGDKVKDYKYLNDKMLDFRFQDEKLVGISSSGMSMDVIVSGGLGVSSIDVDARYTAFGGYHLIMNVDQEFYLIVEILADIHEEVRIPIIGLNVPFGIGSVAGGLFIIVGVDGNIRIEAEAREYAALRVGIKGGTFFGVPTSFHGVGEKKFITEGDVDIAGKINGYVKLGPLLDITVLGMDLVGAGVLLGVGLEVEAENTVLDVNLYASMEIYIKIVGKTISIINWKPSLLHKRQQAMGGYRVNIQEAYLHLGRVGGYIEDMHGIKPIRVQAGMPYQIIVVPSGVNRESFTDQQVRIYPGKDEWLYTNEEAEFFYDGPEPVESGLTAEEYQLKKASWLQGGEWVAIRFQADNQTFRSDAQEATLPFDKVIISTADYFNDYAIGSVAPAKVIKWDARQVAKDGIPADPPEKQFEYVKYSNGTLHLQGLRGVPVNTQLSEITVLYFPVGSQATVKTDAEGDFDTRNPAMLPAGNYSPVFNQALQILPSSPASSADKLTTGIKATFDAFGHTKSQTIQVWPFAPLSIRTETFPVEGSYRQFSEGERIIDQMQVDEIVYISNGGGPRILSQQELVEYAVEGWSNQDLMSVEYNKSLNLYTTIKKTGVVKQTESGSDYIVTPVLDENGNSTGTAMLQRRIILEWVWQEHPYPLEIMTKEAQINADGGSVQLSAKGIMPFHWSLRGAPQGVTIDPASGKLAVAPGLPADSYTFTVCLEQDRDFFSTDAREDQMMSEGSVYIGLENILTGHYAAYTTANKDNPVDVRPFYADDPALPVEQTFTLTIKAPPVLDDSAHGYKFQTQFGRQAAFDIHAAGSKMITYAIGTARGTATAPPPELTIDANTGKLSVSDKMPVGEYKFVVIAKNDVGTDERLCTLEVTAKAPSTRTAPKLDNARHGYQFSMTEGEALTVDIRATGSEPIAYSVNPVSASKPVPDGIEINAGSGRLTVSGNMRVGRYEFIVRAENDAGKDEKTCVLSIAEKVVNPVRTAPVIAEEAHGYTFSKLINGGDLVVPIYAKGSTPIVWSLEQKSERYFIPKEVTIDPSTGVLTVKEGIEAGDYSFVIRAQNDVGFDTRECALSVTSLVRPPRLSRISVPTSSYGQIITLAASSGVPAQQPAQTPMNVTTIRVDHEADTYSLDRFKPNLNGAEFIRWDSTCKMNIEGIEETLSYCPPLSGNDNYHFYYDPTDPTLDDIFKDEKRVQDIKDALKGGYLGKYLQEQHDQYITNPWDESIGGIPGLQSEIAPLSQIGVNRVMDKGLLHYGITVDAIQSQRGGLHNVQLGGAFGSAVTGKFFEALQQNPAANIAFEQQGATIAFSGSAVKNADAESMIDLGFIPSALHESEMKAAVSQGERAFVYSFLGHGELPGVATFSITTDIAEGMQVNVYKYDAATGGFTLIAGNLAVGAGGVVTYKNNTMSEYLITTETIVGAQVSDMAGRQGFAGNISWLPIVIIGLGAAGLAVAVWVFLRRRKRIRKSQ